MFERVNIFFDKINTKVHSIFNLDEIFESKPLFFLMIVAYVILFRFLNDSYNYLGTKTVKIQCWSFFPNCSPYQDFFFFNYWIDLRPIFFAFLLALFLVTIFLTYKKKYGLSHLTLILFSFLNFFPILLTTNNYNIFVHHQDHYFFYTLLLLIFVTKNRHYYLTFFFALTYIISALPKVLSYDWILGTIGIPYISPLLFPVLSNSLILLQIVIPFIILYGNKNLRVLSVLVFESFHLYTSTIWNVKYTFILQILPFLFVLFVTDFKRPSFENLKKSLVGVSIIGIFLFMSLVRVFIPGDDYFTTEGSGYSLNMFFQRGRCSYEFHDKDMKYNLEQNLTSSEPCEVYKILNNLKKECVDDRPRRLKIEMWGVFTHTTIVDEQNFCKLNFKPFAHNSWIRTSFDKVGLVDPALLNSTQWYIYPFLGELFALYYGLFWIFLTMIFYYLWRKEVDDNK